MRNCEPYNEVSKETLNSHYLLQHGTGLFAIFIHPVIFYCSPFCLDMPTHFLLCTKIEHIICGVRVEFWQVKCYNTSGYLLIERGELMRADKKGQNEVWLHAKPVSSDVCME